MIENQLSSFSSINRTASLRTGISDSARVQPVPDLLAPPSATIGDVRSPSVVHEQFQDLTFATSDTFYRARLPKSLHWSIVWSDLMMTMFILFLTMYAYQVAHEDFLVERKPEIIGGSTSDAMDISGQDNTASLPAPLANNTVPLMTSGTVKKIETAEPVTGIAMTPEEEKKISRFDIITAFVEQEKQAEKAVKTESQEEPTDTVIQPAPLLPSSSMEIATLNAIHSQSLLAVEKNNLEDLASVDRAPDGTMRIILSGDLLFETGRADLSSTARQSLQKIAAGFKEAPYMINVTGHTDNLPMHSDRFTSNWELSVARASQVARFLIEVMGMAPSQFVVSGYSSYRPLKPNTTAENRASNRRVEILFSNKMPPTSSVEPERPQHLLPR